MSELQQEGTYEGRIQFEVIPAAETAQRGDEIVRFGFEELKHGLVGFDANGEVAGSLPGHRYGREEILGVIQAALGGS